MVFAVDIEDPYARVEAFWSQYGKDLSWHDGTFIPHCKLHSVTLHSAKKCTTVFLLTVPQILCNRAGNLHGGAAAAVFDMLTTVCLAPIARGATDSKPSFWQWAGVSRSLTCTYLRPVPEGTTVAVVCEIVGAGARLCALRGEMREFDARSGTILDEVLVSCEHGKVSVEPPDTLRDKQTGSSKL